MNAMARMPALFLGHGSPMAAIEPSQHTAVWQQLGRDLPRPRAILAISAHWFTRGIGITTNESPRTIHDFYGFPPALFAVQYPARGDAALAARVAQLLAAEGAQGVEEWGLDHGSWSVLRYLYPDADIPVVQLSIDGLRSARTHYQMARKLGVLRDEGVLILGSGNVVHNLRVMQRRTDAPAPNWALDFNTAIRAALLARDHDTLIDYEAQGESARMSVPTPEHYLPLLYVAAQQDDGDSVTLPTDGVEMGSISMLSALISPARRAA
ncbi:MAG: 4,5-DOPA dioxygenase extradiol [Steroidobacteraceae bacterium]